MCDGQYSRRMQDYLREQPDNIHNINIVFQVARFTRDIPKDMYNDTVIMEQLHLILQTLIEMCVGNYRNQAVIFDCQIIEVINRILQLRREAIDDKDSGANKKASDTTWAACKIQDLECTCTLGLWLLYPK